MCALLPSALSIAEEGRQCLCSSQGGMIIDTGGAGKKLLGSGPKEGDVNPADCSLTVLDFYPFSLGRELGEYDSTGNRSDD